MSHLLQARAASGSSDVVERLVKSNLLKDGFGITIGPHILGFIFDMVLYGVMMHQMIVWASAAGIDRTFHRYLLYWSVLTGTATTVFTIWYTWGLFVSGFGVYSNFVNSDRIGWYGMLSPLSTVPIQCFYLERAYRINQKKWWIPLLVLPLILAGAAGGLGVCIVMVREHNVLNVRKTLQATKPLFSVGQSTIMAADIALCGFIMYGLSKSRTGFTETDRLVKRLIRISVETCIPCLIVAIAFEINFMVDSSSHLNFFWLMLQPKVYVVTFLAVLNYRVGLRKEFVSTSGGGSTHRRENAFKGRSTAMQQETLQLGELHDAQGEDRNRADSLASSKAPIDQFGSQTGLTTTEKTAWEGPFAPTQ